MKVNTRYYTSESSQSERAKNYPLVQMYFCKGNDYGVKVDLIKGYWDLRINVGNHAFFRDNLATIILKKR